MIEIQLMIMWESFSISTEPWNVCRHLHSFLKFLLMSEKNYYIFDCAWLKSHAITPKKCGLPVHKTWSSWGFHIQVSSTWNNLLCDSARFAASWQRGFPWPPQPAILYSITFLYFHSEQLSLCSIFRICSDLSVFLF
jgi:hypothetical protein